MASETRRAADRERYRERKEEGWCVRNGCPNEAIPGQFAHEQHRQMLTLLNAREDESLMDAIQRTVSENRGENEKS